MKSILFALFFLSASLAQGQQPTVRETELKNEAECGNPLVESMAWAVVSGTVVRVVDGRSFLLKTGEGKMVEVVLGAVDYGRGNEKRRNALSSWIQDRPVTVLVNPQSRDAKSVVGVVHSASLDVNRELLRTGVAKYKEPIAYSVSNYVACTYRIAEREAKQEKRGLWQ